MESCNTHQYNKVDSLVMIQERDCLSWCYCFVPLLENLFIILGKMFLYFLYRVTSLWVYCIFLPIKLTTIYCHCEFVNFHFQDLSSSSSSHASPARVFSFLPSACWVWSSGFSPGYSVLCPASTTEVTKDLQFWEISQKKSTH